MEYLDPEEALVHFYLIRLIIQATVASLRGQAHGLISEASIRTIHNNFANPPMSASEVPSFEWKDGTKPLSIASFTI